MKADMDNEGNRKRRSRDFIGVWLCRRRESTPMRSVLCFHPRPATVLSASLSLTLFLSLSLRPGFSTSRTRVAEWTASGDD